MGTTMAKISAEGREDSIATQSSQSLGGGGGGGGVFASVVYIDPEEQVFALSCIFFRESPPLKVS